jgi:hypothetical protein
MGFFFLCQHKINSMLTDKDKTIKRLRILIIISCLLTGFLAGENVDRYLVQVPAWRQMNMITWAQFVRHADMSMNGILLYPGEAIISAGLLIIASVIVLKNRIEFSVVAKPLHTSTCFALAGLGLTIFAAPYLLSVWSMPDDPEFLQHQFNHFHFWGAWRAAAQILSFFFCILAVGKSFTIEKEKSELHS